MKRQEGLKVWKKQTLPLTDYMPKMAGWVSSQTGKFYIKDSKFHRRPEGQSATFQKNTTSNKKQRHKTCKKTQTLHKPTHFRKQHYIMSVVERLFISEFQQKLLQFNSSLILISSYLQYLFWSWLLSFGNTWESFWVYHICDDSQCYCLQLWFIEWVLKKQRTQFGRSEV